MAMLRFDRNFFIVTVTDVLLLLASFYLAHLVRFDFDMPVYFRAMMLQIMPLAIIIKLFVFYFFDLYRGMWRYTSIFDLLNIIKAVSVSSLLLTFAILFSSSRFIGFSRSVILIDWCFSLLLLTGSRLLIRVYYERYSDERSSIADILTTLADLVRKPSSSGKRILIIGAGVCGEKLYREIRANTGLRYEAVGFLDDDPAKMGKKIHGVAVMNTVSELTDVAKMVRADEAIIAIPSASAAQMKRIIDCCKNSDLKFRTVPSLAEMIDGKVSISAVREVAYRDLLGREPVNLDKEIIGAYLEGQSVFVSGAGGSIGSELCRQIARFGPKRMTLYERAESPLYDIELDLREHFPAIEVFPILADIRDQQQVERAFQRVDPNVVFHAAAYKHVPMLEMNPWKAIENNIQGTATMVEVTKRFPVDRFVLVSTDKAVRPSNVMGASKRIAEMIVQNQNLCSVSNTRFITVRFGNVVGSVGSVIPRFKKQIAQGGPVTVTDPEVTRYFMTIPEACQLILQAGAMGNRGEIFILEMGIPIKIDQMARDLIRLSGFEPDMDIRIEYIGLRPGEKLYEELIIDGEDVLPTSHEKIMVLRGSECDLATLNGGIGKLVELSEKQEILGLKEKLKEILPEYTPSLT